VRRSLSSVGGQAVVVGAHHTLPNSLLTPASRAVTSCAISWPNVSVSRTSSASVASSPALHTIWAAGAGSRAMQYANLAALAEGLQICVEAGHRCIAIFEKRSRSVAAAEGNRIGLGDGLVHPLEKFPHAVGVCGVHKVTQLLTTNADIST
jgi:hypothetical protein